MTELPEMPEYFLSKLLRNQRKCQNLMKYHGKSQRCHNGSEKEKSPPNQTRLNEVKNPETVAMQGLEWHA